jgi:hypothetical protein
MCTELTSNLHERFLLLLPKIEVHGQIHFRHLAPQHKDEIFQEMRALAWKWFLRLSRRGKDAAAFLVTFNSYLTKAIKCGRRITGQEKAKDVMCQRTQRRHGFRVQPLPSTRASFEGLYAEVHGQHEHDAFEDQLKENTVTPIPDQAAFRIDWPAWMKTRAARDRQIIHQLANGEQGRDISRRFGLSPARVSQLRSEFHQDWERFCGMDEVAATA